MLESLSLCAPKSGCNPFRKAGTPWKFNIFAPENGWLEDEFPFGFWPIFRGYVKLRGGNRSTKSGEFFLSFPEEEHVQTTEAKKKTKEATSRPRVLFILLHGGNFSASKKGESLERKTTCHFVTKNHEVLWFFWNQLWPTKKGCLTWDILGAAVLLRFPTFNFWNDFGPVGNRKKNQLREWYFFTSPVVRLNGQLWRWTSLEKTGKLSKKMCQPLYVNAVCFGHPYLTWF